MATRCCLPTPSSRGYAFRPLESYAEGPHAVATRIFSKTRRARLPWVCSTMRVDQNVSDVRSFAADHEVDLQQCWHNAFSVVKPPGRYDYRAPKMKRAKVLSKLYYLKQAFVPTALVVAEDVGGDASGGGGGGADDEGGYDIDAEPPAGVPLAIVPAVLKLPESKRALVEYLHGCIPAMSTFTVPSITRGGCPQAYMLLRKHERRCFVKTYNIASLTSGIQWMVQRYEIL